MKTLSFFEKLRKLMLFISLFVALFLISNINAQSYKILESTSSHLKVEFNFVDSYSIEEKVIEGKTFTFIKGDEMGFLKPEDPLLPKFNTNIGIPFNSKTSIKIINVISEKMKNIFILPVPDSINQAFKDLNYNKNIYQNNSSFPNLPAKIEKEFIMRYLKIVSLSIFPYQYNPVMRELTINKSLVVQVDFEKEKNSDFVLNKITDKATEDYASTLINKNEASNFIAQPSSKTLLKESSETSWYDPQKDYYKIYLNQKGVYRITYDYLVSAGVPLGTGIELNKLELFNMGKEIPIDVIDENEDGLFNSGDYFNFIGYPPQSTNEFTYHNIYNIKNVYWFSYQNNSEAIRYLEQDGFPKTWDNTYQTSLETIHYEEDEIYERLGYASNDNRDFWFWGKASAQGGTVLQRFNAIFPTFPGFILDSNRVTLRVNMHGMTLGSSTQCPDNHKAYISLTDQPVGTAVWRNQESHTFEKVFYVAEDSIRIFPTGNSFKVEVRGDACSNLNSDEIRINWYEFEYWKGNRTEENNFSFISPPPHSGINRYWLYGWQRDNMKVYIPNRGLLISKPQIVNDEYNSVLFVDTVSEKSEYFCVSNDYYLLPDSIKKNQPSDIRNTAQGADYIIITHPDFLNAAQKLSDFRSNNLPNFSSPRVKLLDVNKIYDEFSFGLLDPNAIRDFIKHAFENWQKPSPMYVVLFGDMSHDYRNVTNSKHKNYIPSIMYFARTFGLVASDNLLVAVSGEDISPDLVIGRLSCETPEEAEILVDKIINYPADNSKLWKEDVLLLASGLSEEDQKLFGFNNQSKYLENTYLKPNGIKASKVFNFPDPDNPEDLQFKGAGPRMREEFNEGTVVANYYGHGGGGQWDLVFTNDDIKELENENRFPLVLSVTCYTAHFDDQDAFGEIFIKSPGKGAIGFWGSTALTYWGSGTSINNLLYKHIFNNKNYVVGSSILNAKSDIFGSSDMIAQLTYLGDPAVELAIPKNPDFEIKSSYITYSPLNPLKDDTVQVSVKIKNLGLTFPGDTVIVELFLNNTSQTNLINEIKVPSFGDETTAVFNWIPQESGSFNLIAVVNQNDAVIELDHSDNIANTSISVFNISEPNIIHPVDGYSTNGNSMNFLIADISDFIDESITYYFEIDTSLAFSNPIAKPDAVKPDNGTVKWSKTDLVTNQIYFWRVRIFDGETFGNWSGTRSFSINNSGKDGYYAYEKILKTFETVNINYLENEKSLVLNSSLSPPRPSNENLIEDILPNTNVLDSIGLTTLTTDGTYLYFGNIWYYAQNLNPQAKSFIYKIGTGNNGTTKGEYYGVVSNFYDRISMQIFYHSDGFLYIATGNPHYLKKINISSGVTSSVYIPDGLLTWDTAKPENGSFYISSDGKYVYNLTVLDTLKNQRYTLRIFDPSNNWNLVQPDISLTSSFTGFSGFFAADGYIYPYENFFSGYMRKIRALDGFFEEEWITVQPFQGYYAWCYDWENNNVYASVFRSGYEPKIAKFEGRYLDAEGTIRTPVIGPALNWKSINYNVENLNSNGSYSSYLLGLSNETNKWDTLIINLPSNYLNDTIDAKKYPYLQANFNLVDSSFSLVNPMEFKSIHFSYDLLPEILISKNNLVITPDSVLEGLPLELSLKVDNIGFQTLDSLNLNFYLNSTDSAFTSKIITINPNSSVDISIQIDSRSLNHNNTINVIASSSTPEFFTFNNSSSISFIVAKDSTKPNLFVTFDGEEILDGDIVSSNPEITIILNDNSPLPLDTSLIDISYTYGNTTSFLSYFRDNFTTEYIPYPNSQFTAKWNPKLPDGEHRINIRARDASGNFFDSTSYSISFLVSNNSDLLNVYNYPNPFSSETHFTFQLTGLTIPEELYIKIYTVAGRLIREIKIQSSDLKIGFNKFYWDGKDQDGDEIANGLYFYKTVSKFNDVTKTSLQKLAKVR